MLPLLSAAEMQEVDRYATQNLSVPELLMMEHAALGVAQALKDRYGDLLPDTRGVVLAGPGNNGGDACAVARILSHWGCTRLFVALFADENRLGPTASLQLEMLGRISVPWSHELDPEVVAACDWIVDGIFGTGLKRPPEGPARAAIETVNRTAGTKWVVAIDIPSGLSSDTGNPLEVAVRARETVTLGFHKRGLVTGQAADYVGRLRLASLPIPEQLPAAAGRALLYTREDASRLPERRRSGHKGDYGHVYIWAGRADKQGACLIASLAALRAGAGLVSLVGDKEDLDALRPRLPPEVMTQDWAADLFEKRHEEVAAIGPGLGTDERRWKILEAALRSDWALVLDADALSLIAAGGEKARSLVRSRSGRVTVLTPHPKEAARLMGCEVAEIERDRYASCQALGDRYGAAILLKGKGTLIGGGQRPLVVVTAGDTGLSKGGSGDCLTGILASLLAQRVMIDKALPLSAYLHGAASEWMTRRYGQERSTLASEVAGCLPDVLRELEWRKHTPARC